MTSLKTSRQLLAAAIAVAAALLAAPSSARAQGPLLTNWTGTISTDWFTPGNWDLGVPGPNTFTTNIPSSTVPVGTALIAGRAAAGGTFLNVGPFNGSTGMLTINNGGTLNAGSVSIGSFLTSQGTVTVTGEGSALTTTNQILVGVLGTGTLTISNGAVVTAPRVDIARGTAGPAPGGGPGFRGTLNIGAPAGMAPVAPGTLVTPVVGIGATTLVTLPPPAAPAPLTSTTRPPTTCLRPRSPRALPLASSTCSRARPS